METSKVYLKVDCNGKTQNVFATLGMAIDDLNFEEKRIDPSFVKHKTLSSLKWRGRDGKDYSYEIKECLVCNDIHVDYMNTPRALAL